MTFIWLYWGGSNLAIDWQRCFRCSLTVSCICLPVCAWVSVSADVGFGCGIVTIRVIDHLCCLCRSLERKLQRPILAKSRTLPSIPQSPTVSRVHHSDLIGGSPPRMKNPPVATSHSKACTLPPAGKDRMEASTTQLAYFFSANRVWRNNIKRLVRIKVMQLTTLWSGHDHFCLKKVIIISICSNLRENWPCGRTSPPVYGVSMERWRWGKQQQQDPCSKHTWHG